MVQYNLYGDEEVTDLDGEVLTEKTAARKWGIAFTPTILFLPEGADGSLDARQAAVASMPGAFQKGTFLDMFTRSEEHTSELQSLMRNSYAVFCLKNKKTKHKQIYIIIHTDPIASS